MYLFFRANPEERRAMDTVMDGIIGGRRRGKGGWGVGGEIRGRGRGRGGARRRTGRAVGPIPTTIVELSDRRAAKREAE